MLISVVAIVLAAALPTFFRSLRLSKISEASRQLEQISAHASAYYAKAHPTSAGLRNGCLPEAAGPAPAKPSVKPVYVKLAATEVPGSPTWTAIGYELDEPIRYRYSLIPSTPGCAGSERPEGTSLVLRAEGDLDGDGVLSLFERTLRIVSDELVPEPLFVTRDRTE